MPDPLSQDRCPEQDPLGTEAMLQCRHHFTGLERHRARQAVQEVDKGDGIEAAGFGGRVSEGGVGENIVLNRGQDPGAIGLGVSVVANASGGVGERRGLDVYEGEGRGWGIGGTAEVVASALFLRNSGRTESEIRT